jgi:multiple sugar transport system permease protein
MQSDTILPSGDGKDFLKPGGRGIARRLRDKLGGIAQFESFLLLAPVLLALALFFFGPAVFNILLSFQNVSLFHLARGGEWVGLANFVDILQDPNLGLALNNTAFWLTGVTVVLRLILGMGLALMLNLPVLRRWKLQGVARLLVLLPWIIPPTVAVAAWEWMLHPRYGLINQVLIETRLIDNGIPFFARTSTVWWAIVVVLVWREVPFVVISFLAGLQSIPEELREAARIDGASERQVFRHVTLPLLRPVIVVVILLMTIWTFNNFLYVWLTTGGGPGNYTQVLATHMYVEAFINFQVGKGAAIGVVMSAIMTLFAVIYFRAIFRKNVGVAAS